jgi:hypothetical protein
MVQPYDVVRGFTASEPISGRQHQFKLGDQVSCDLGQVGATTVVEAHLTLYLVDRATFEECCKFRNDGSAAF